MKILSPVGNFESLKAAVFNGADELYLGINEFNARNNIDGFSLENLKEAIDFAHVFGVKVLLAINILFSDEEMQAALDVVIDAYNMGTDAFIVQDLGLIKILYENYPEIELHASTQTGLHNAEGVKELERFGIKRAVLSRETPLKEIKRIKENCNVEIEYFVQGALCVSFSGNCYLSSYLCGASGNRGRCKQLCRLPYTLEKDGKKIKSGYLLSAKDFNMSKRLRDLQNAGVDVLKIEGRARRPYYVAVSTREYFKAVHEGGKVNEEAFSIAFNRNYTEGYFNGNGNIISNVKSHIGIPVGKVDRVNCGKKFNEVFILSSRKLNKKSTFKFFSGENEGASLSAFDLQKYGDNCYRLTTTVKGIKAGDTVRLIADVEEEARALSVKKRRDLPIEIYAEENKSIRAVAAFSGKTFEIRGDVLTKAEKLPLTEEELKRNFNKHDLFKADLTVKKLDGVFISKQSLNAFRRKVFETVYNFVSENSNRNAKKIVPKKPLKVNGFTDFEFVEDKNAKLTAENVIYSPEKYILSDVEEFVYRCKKDGKNAYLDTPCFASEKDIERLKEIVSKSGVGIVANNYYALSLGAKTVFGAGLNAYNSFTAGAYPFPVITAESDIAKRVNFPYMTLLHCPIKAHLGGSCKSCRYTEGIVYRMASGKVLKLKRKKLSECVFYLTD